MESILGNPPGGPNTRKILAPVRASSDNTFRATFFLSHFLQTCGNGFRRALSADFEETMRTTHRVPWLMIGALLMAGCRGKGPVEGAVDMVKQLGGKVEIDANLPNKPVVTVDLRDTAVTDADLERLQALPHLQILALDGTGISDAGLESLKQCSRLERLFLRNTRATPEGIKDLQKTLPKADIKY
jgi:hypothetical protein